MKTRQKLLWLSSTLCALGATAENVEQPNVLFIMIDDMGMNQISAYGSDFFETPNIDAIAAEGMMFNNAYAGAAVSSPSRAAFLTGDSPCSLHLTDWLNGNTEPSTLTLTCPSWQKGLTEDQLLLPEVFGDAGYVTAMIGKWHVSSYEGAFDVFLRNDGPETDDVEDRHHTVEYTTNAIDFMTEYKDTPFFCFLSHNTIHTPESEDADLVSKYAAKEGATSGGFKNPTQGAMVERLDDEIGRLMTALEELGLDEKTIVVFYSDNGQYSPNQKIGDGSDLRGSKVTLHEGGVKMPFIVRWKGTVEAQSSCDERVIGYDMLPTLVDMCGIETDKLDDIEGISFATNILDDPTNDLGRETLCWHYPHYHPEAQFIGAIRKGDWKLIENFDQTLYYNQGGWELYNLADDPTESNNLWSSNLAKSSELYYDLQAWRDEVGAQMPLCLYESYGKEHFNFHTSNATIKANEFEAQSSLTAGLESDGEGTYLSLATNATLSYLLDATETEATQLSFMVKNTASTEGSLQVVLGSDTQYIPIEVSSSWKQYDLTLTTPLQDLGLLWVKCATGSLQLDKLVATNADVTLEHDGEIEETPTMVLATFEGDTPLGLFASVTTGNVNHQTTPTVVENTNWSDANSTEGCLYIQSKQDVDALIPGWWANSFVMKLIDPIEITSENQYLHIMHWKGNVLNNWLVYGTNEAGSEIELGRGECPAAQEWFDIVVDLSGNASELSQIRVLLDGNWSGTGEEKYYAPTDFYYDEIILSSDYLGRTAVSSQQNTTIAQQEKELNIRFDEQTKTLQFSSEKQLNTLSIYASNGVLIKQMELGTTQSEVVLSALSAGIYIVHCTVEGGDDIRQRLFIR